MPGLENLLKSQPNSQDVQCALGKNMYFVFVGQNALQVSVRSIVLECCSNVLLLLIFFILSIIESGVLKAPAVTVDYLFLIPVLSGFFFSFMFSRICCQMNPLLFSHSVVSDSLRTQGLSPARLVRCIYFYNFYVFLMDWPFVIVKYPPQSFELSFFFAFTNQKRCITVSLVTNQFLPVRSCGWCKERNYSYLVRLIYTEHESYKQ